MINTFFLQIIYTKLASNSTLKTTNLKGQTFPFPVKPLFMLCLQLRKLGYVLLQNSCYCCLEPILKSGVSLYMY